MGEDMTLRAQGIYKSYGDLDVLADLSVEFPAQSISCVMGPSGVGKTTLLNILGGLIEPGAGQVSGLNEEPVSYLFQEPRLLPWKTVHGNLEFVLRGAYTHRDERSKVIADVLGLVDMTDFAHFYPAQLSGGMKQRVSVARAFAFPSTVLLMDEPFKALDLRLKYALMQAFLRLWSADRRTVVCVTHDIDEALFLADAIHILSGKPATITGTYTLPTPRAERRPGGPGSAAIRSELTELLVNP